MRRTKRQRMRNLREDERRKAAEAEAREAFARADAWARSPDGESYSEVLTRLDAEAEQ